MILSTLEPGKCSDSVVCSSVGDEPSKYKASYNKLISQPPYVQEDGLMVGIMERTTEKVSEINEIILEGATSSP